MQLRKTGNYVPNAEQIVHVKETLGLLSIMTNDSRFEDALNADAYFYDGKEIKNMCDVLDRVENKGRAEGEEKKAKDMAVSLYKQGVKPDVIATAAGVTVAVVEKWLGLVLV